MNISLINYSQNTFSVSESKELGFLEDYVIPEEENTWIDVSGNLDEVNIMQLSGKFGLHPVVLSDMTDRRKRTRIEYFRDYIYMTIRMVEQDSDGDMVSREIAVILGKKYIITLHEKGLPVLDRIKKRLEDPNAALRYHGPLFILYLIIEEILDIYYNILENFESIIERYQERIISKPDPGSLKAMTRTRRNLLFIRKTAWVTRDVVSGLERGDIGFFEDKMIPYFRNSGSHFAQLLETIETMREMLSEILEIYMYGVSNRLNEIVKVLTLFSSIFIPLTFIASIYGMNFKYFPELEWKYSYPVILAVFLAVGLSLFFFFKRKKWF